jgi:hypothetical protein
MAILAVFPHALRSLDLPQWVQAVSAMVMVRLTVKLSAVAKTQTEIARSQHIAANRPKLLVREPLVLVGPKAGQCSVQFDVVNVGGSAAIPFCSVVRFDKSQRNGRPYSINPKLKKPPERENFLSADTLEPGEVVHVCIPGTFKWEVLDAALAVPNAARVVSDCVALHGTIYYHDQNGTMRRTSFWRSYNFVAGGFDKCGDPDIEFAD